MKHVTITGSRDSLDDMLAQLRQDFEHGQIPCVVAHTTSGTMLKIEFLEVSETVFELEFEFEERMYYAKHLYKYIEKPVKVSQDTGPARTGILKSINEDGVRVLYDGDSKPTRVAAWKVWGGD